MSMKKSFVALSVLSGMFLASSALAAPKQWIGDSLAQAEASFSVSAFSDLKFGASSSKSFNGIVNAGDELFELTVTAPQGMKVAVAGDVISLGASAGDISSSTAPNGGSSITATLADKSFLKSNAYIPPGVIDANNAGAGAVVVDGTGAETKVVFIASRDNYGITPGKYGYSFVAQAFTE
ncbi:hypothetical protein [Cedecea neteri]|nr:hypothetical protein [Cedecea neteri]